MEEASPVSFLIGLFPDAEFDQTTKIQDPYQIQRSHNTSGIDDFDLLKAGNIYYANPVYIYDLLHKGLLLIQ
jgi:hypothetical protein